MAESEQLNKRICLQCDKPDNESAPYILRSYDLTGRLFCSIQHFQEYYKEHNPNQVIQSHDLLSAAQLLSINEDDLSFGKNIEALPDEEKLKAIEASILDLRRLQQKYKAMEVLRQKRKMTIRGNQESEKVERYRKYGVNSDRELTVKHLSAIEKRIISYRKMNMKDDILEEILVGTFKKFSREEIKKIMSEVK